MFAHGINKFCRGDRSIVIVLGAHFNFAVTVILLKSCSGQPADLHAWLFTVVPCVANKG